MDFACDLRQFHSLRQVMPAFVGILKVPIVSPPGFYGVLQVYLIASQGIRVA